jgi:hypothetical protein
MAANYDTRINGWLIWITLTILMKPIRMDFARGFLGVKFQRVQDRFLQTLR